MYKGRSISWEATMTKDLSLFRHTNAFAGQDPVRLAVAAAVDAFVQRTGSPPGPGSAGVWVDRALTAYDNRGRS